MSLTGFLLHVKIVCSHGKTFLDVVVVFSFSIIPLEAVVEHCSLKFAKSGPHCIVPFP
jgi:hypothetical protein